MPGLQRRVQRLHRNEVRVACGGGSPVIREAEHLNVDEACVLREGVRTRAKLHRAYLEHLQILCRQDAAGDSVGRGDGLDHTCPLLEIALR